MEKYLFIKPRPYATPSIFIQLWPWMQSLIWIGRWPLDAHLRKVDFPWDLIYCVHYIHGLFLWNAVIIFIIKICKCLFSRWLKNRTLSIWQCLEWGILKMQKLQFSYIKLIHSFCSVFLKCLILSSFFF